MDNELTRRMALTGAAALMATGPALAKTGFVPGANVIQTKDAPFGSSAAAESLKALKDTGAKSCAIVPFLWQPGPNDARLVEGSDMTLQQLRAGIGQAKAAGLKVLVKPHVWVPGGWAGMVEMKSEGDWSRWFAAFGRTMDAYAAVAASAGADSVCVGTELVRTVRRPEWKGVIATLRKSFKGPLTYAAHGVDEARSIPFWSSLDSVGVTLYPALGADGAPKAWRKAMDAEVGRLGALASHWGKPARVLEVGLRSAKGAALKPWESAEERPADAAPALQADVLDQWMRALDRPFVSEVLVWRWFTDPRAGGPADTDFTVQNKLAQARLATRWA